MPTNDFVAKHWQRWPEWQFVSVFLPQSTRVVVQDWYALQNEFWLASEGFEDPTPGQAKLAWWQEELRGWSRGLRRHPLGVSLQSQSAHWAQIADALSRSADPAAMARALALVDFDLQGQSVGGNVDLSGVAALIAFERDLIASSRPSVPTGNPRQLSRARAMHLALARARAKSADPLKPLSPLRATLTCWNAARISRG